MRLTPLALILLAVSGGSALAAPSPFAGTWKLDPAKSKFTGETITYSKTATGLHFSNGATVAYDITLDGKDHPTMFDRTAAWSSAGKNGWDAVNKAHGVVMSKAHSALSADGNTMTVAYTVNRADGSVVRESDVYKRVAGGPGLAGTWKDVGGKTASFDMTIAIPGPGKFTIAYPASKSTVAGRTDGSPSPFTGPTAPPGAVSHVRAVGPSRWNIDGTLKGKTYFAGDMTVSTDGKTLTRTTWVPGKRAETTVEVFDRAG